MGDVEAGMLHMRPIHSFLASDIVFADDRRTLDGLEPKPRAALLAVVAGFLPYYTEEAQVRIAGRVFGASAGIAWKGCCQCSAVQ